MSGIRIMGGDLRGLTVGPLPRNIEARPILARIRKSLFDILMNRLEGSKFLDLFAGSGTVGLEALSRGASRVVFVDANPVSVRWIQSVLDRYANRNPGPLQGRQAEVRRADVLRGLAGFDGPFDLIFSGAPYVDKDKKALYFVNQILTLIARDAALKPGGWFIAQHHAKEPIAPDPLWDCFRQERYGDSRLSFFKHVQ